MCVFLSTIYQVWEAWSGHENTRMCVFVLFRILGQNKFWTNSEGKMQTHWRRVFCFSPIPWGFRREMSVWISTQKKNKKIAATFSPTDTWTFVTSATYFPDLKLASEVLGLSLATLTAPEVPREKRSTAEIGRQSYSGSWMEWPHLQSNTSGVFLEITEARETQINCKSDVCRCSSKHSRASVGMGRLMGRCFELAETLASTRPFPSRGAPTRSWCSLRCVQSTRARYWLLTACAWPCHISFFEILCTTTWVSLFSFRSWWELARRLCLDRSQQSIASRRG